MAEKIPRRLMRFNRAAAKAEAGGENLSDANQEKVQEEKSEEEFAPTGRRILREIPSMKYEDLDAATKKDYSELKKAKVRSAAEEMALKEVEKFKRKNNRLPNKEESETIADNLYTQLKNVDTDKLYGIKKAGKGEEKRDRKRTRAQRREKKEEGGFSEPAKQGSGNVADIKKLLEEETSAPTADEEAKEGEFDLGLGDSKEEGGELGELEEIEGKDNLGVEDSETCPNCKKETDKIIYCPKCGTAFCGKCSKKDTGGFACPKCGAKIKQ